VCCLVVRSRMRVLAPTAGRVVCARPPFVTAHLWAPSWARVVNKIDSESQKSKMYQRMKNKFSCGEVLAAAAGSAGRGAARAEPEFILHASASSTGHALGGSVGAAARCPAQLRLASSQVHESDKAFTLSPAFHTPLLEKTRIKVQRSSLCTLIRVPFAPWHLDSRFPHLKWHAERGGQTRGWSGVLVALTWAACSRVGRV
jgi:hypothetical protein